MIEKGTYNAPSREEEKILALEAQLTKLRKNAKEFGKKKGKGNKSKTPDKGRNQSDNGEKRRQGGKKNQAEKPRWMFQRPSDNQLNAPKTWQNKPWYYCGAETGGKCDGVYRRHKPSECKGTAHKREAQKGDTSNNKNKEPKRLKVASTLLKMLHQDMEEESE